ncbi:hypothetical protein [Corynebacterium kutscheri]|uniref:Polyketide cyclase / dehydrase and lipid transport n=1 Tax=Corynebacterium kutscheri TaxID=35755 RepID=A0AB38VRJ1_9CORY|nr:hypothetical protein [Corynebacterium kutscheri]VEH06488.1 Uncharacterised protein [Corynebacterium kutscheri]
MGKLTVVWEEELPYSAQQFWHVVTDLTNWQWRSDLSLCEVIDERKFIEFPKKANLYDFIQPVSKNPIFGNFK